MEDPQDYKATVTRTEALLGGVCTTGASISAFVDAMWKAAPGIIGDKLKRLAAEGRRVVNAPAYQRLAKHHADELDSIKTGIHVSWQATVNGFDGGSKTALKTICNSAALVFRGGRACSPAKLDVRVCNNWGPHAGSASYA